MFLSAKESDFPISSKPSPSIGQIIELNSAQDRSAVDGLQNQ
jgi:hypothetical protein